MNRKSPRMRFVQLNQIVKKILFYSTLGMNFLPLAKTNFIQFIVNHAIKNISRFCFLLTEILSLK